ncbi:MAG: hypothetical protein ABJH07_11460 [Sedimentitalea sp.]|uniref:hypothetical protein n=1 Tax=Sedimentitalea sp. TaxID=2048915 RepID=UPI003298728C
MMTSLRRPLSVALFLFALSLSFNSPATSGETYALTPLDRPALTEAGPIIVSDSKLIFSDGSQIGVTEVPGNFDPEGLPDDTQATFLAIEDADIGKSLPFETCDGQPFRYVLAMEQPEQGFVTLLFGTNAEQATFFDHVCRRYLFQRPPRASKGPDGEELSGKWILQKVGPEDGGPAVGIILPADTGANAEGKPYAFIARCKNNTTDAFVAFNEQKSGDALMTIVDIAGQSRKQEFWGLSNNKSSAFVPGWAGDFLKSMVRGDQMTLNFAERGRVDFDVEFDLRGMEPVLRELSTACNWSF